MSTILAQRAPTSTLDPYTDQALLNPWPLYRELREMRPVVWLEKYRMFALTRYDVVVKALRDWEAFPSSFGVMMNDDMNQVLRGNTLCSDGDAHNRLRRVVMRPVTPVAVRSLQDEVEREAEAVVDRLCAKGRFCAAGELATYLPVTIVSNAVGLPEEGRADDGVEHRHVQLLRPDERASTQRDLRHLQRRVAVLQAPRSVGSSTQ